MAVTGLTFENEVFSKFAFYAAVVLLKTVLMSAWTAVYRIRKKVNVYDIVKLFRYHSVQP